MPPRRNRTNARDFIRNQLDQQANNLSSDNRVRASQIEGYLRLLGLLQETSVLSEEDTPTPTRRRLRVNRNRRPARNRVRRIIHRHFQQNPIRIKETLAENNPNAILFDGLDEALIGICERTGKAIYERNYIIEIFMTRDRMSASEAEEFYEYNVLGTQGADMPIIISLGVDQDGISDLDQIDESEKAVVTKHKKAKKAEKQKKEEQKEQPSGFNPLQGIEL